MSLDKEYWDDLVQGILSEWAYKVSDGSPDATNTTHQIVLREILNDFGWTIETIDLFIYRLKASKAPVLTETVIGVGSPTDDIHTEGTIEALSGVVIEDEEKSKLRKGPATEKGTSRFYFVDNGEDLHLVTKDYGKTQKWRPASQNDVDTKKAAEDGGGETEKPESKPEMKSFSNDTVKRQKAKLEQIGPYIKDKDENTQARNAILMKSWNSFLEATTEEERVQAVRELADSKVIEGHLGGKKIYLSANTTLPYKHLTGDSGNAVTLAMNKIIQDHNIEVDMRGSSSDRALADMSGKHNEAGVVAYLFPSDENKSVYIETQKSFLELGGDEKKFDEINKKAAQQLKDALPEGSKIVGSEQVGGVGKSALMKMGINPKVDPTDLVLHYETAEGDKKMMKVSAKTYTDPRNITMKNSGIGNAGKTYLGRAGLKLDENIKELREKYKWDTMMPADKRQERKKALKEAYLGKFSEVMSKLSESPQGQKRLVKMWQEVHGCGQNVYTQIIHKKTGDVKLKPPKHYCDPKPPFDVKYDGVKILINIGEQNENWLQVDLKTEDRGSVKLLFRHRSK